MIRGRDAEAAGRMDGMKRGGRVRTGRMTVLCLAVALAAGVLARGAEQPKPAALPGFVERSEVSLILLDVEVFDKKGAPMPGLTKEDFRVWLNGFEQQIYSVDDFCPAVRGGEDSGAGPPLETGGSAARGAEGAPPESTGPAATTTQAAPAELAPRPLVIIYLDFLELQADGRNQAIAGAKEWIAKSLAPG